MSKLLNFLKNAAIEFGGAAMNLSDSQIEQLKNDGATEFLPHLTGSMADKCEEIDKVQQKKQLEIENKELFLLQEYRKAFKKRGLDYDKLYVNKYKTDLDYYLKSINMSKDEYYHILSEIKSEVNSIMELNGY